MLPDNIGLVVWSILADRVAHSGVAHDRNGHEVGLQGARLVQVVVDFLGGIGIGVAVGQVQRADGCIDFIGTATPGATGVVILNCCAVLGLAAAITRTASATQVNG